MDGKRQSFVRRRSRKLRTHRRSGPPCSSSAPASRGCSPVRAHPRRLSTLSILPSKLILYGAFVWARGAPTGLKRQFPARAVVAGEDLASTEQAHTRCATP
jgi:hypothetical protein